MRRLAIGLTLAATLGMTGTAMGHGNPALKAARAACQAERQQIGAKAFRQKYGPHSMTACITAHGVTLPPRHHGEGDQGNQGDQGKHHRHTGGHHHGHGDNGNQGHQGNGGGD